MTDIDYSSAIRQEIENRGLLVSRDVALRAALRNFLDATFSSKGDQSDAFLLPRIEILLRALVYRQFSQRETLAALKLSMDRLSGELLHEKSSALSAASVAATPSRDLVHEIVENVAAAFGSYEFRKVIWQHSSQSRDIQENYTFVRNRLLALSLEDLNPSAADVFLTPLWLGIPKPDLGARNELVFSKYLKHEAFEFWREWYQGFLDGKPLDWGLQRRVALIGDAIWEAGPEAVAAEIERIRSLFELEQEITNLKGQLTAVQNTPAAALIGDNGGPPLEDAPARAFQTDLALIWKQIEELEEEVAKPSPSPSLLKKIAKTLWEISLRMAAYCGSVADGMIREGTKELAKAGAKWTARATAVTVTAQTEGVQSVVKAIGAFVKTLQ
ncbi:hypothetical protein [Phaeobacter inhibens]|uniref:hypothetical protein n=1 Tax=Phaeobacter inhibens TaxID=221822 RepID=UPI00076BBC03|nr:hypothetical protein [Phaeobacter inhibens]KXF91220.1 hypothetical protein AT574_08285 [Phaeobacter inhibens]WHP67413.1 hypothetical protein QMZ01_12780 [Phaeobacter inhibens]